MKHNFFAVLTCGVFSYLGERTLYNHYSINWGVSELSLRSIALVEYSKESLLNKLIAFGIAISLLACLALLSGSIKGKYNFEHVTLIISVFISSILLTILSLFAAGTEWLPRYASSSLLFAFLPIFSFYQLKKRNFYE